MTTDLAPISDGVLAELWFALRNKTWRDVTKIVRSSGADQKQLAGRIDMDTGQFNRIISGKAGNVTLRTLHNIARSANHRLQITLEPLSALAKPNYDYDAKEREERDRLLFQRTTEEADETDAWELDVAEANTW